MADPNPRPQPQDHHQDEAAAHPIHLWWGWIQHLNPDALRIPRRAKAQLLAMPQDHPAHPLDTTEGFEAENAVGRVLIF
jgi:hypothetical protein